MNLGLTDSNEDEAKLRRYMTKNSKKSILLCDDSKFDNESFCKIMDFEYIQCIVTNAKPPSLWQNFIERKGIELIYP